MRAVDIIIKKRDGGELSEAEIRFFIEGFTDGSIPDYQAAAWAMAVLLRGMTDRETHDLTMAMVDSGERLDLSPVVGVAVDKHSTGGVGDKTTLAVEPAVAACGVPVGKMSGRGLGFTGGTLDKMESIPGYNVNLTTQEFLDQLATVGVVLCGQTADLAPADGKLYALRDVTGTVPSIPLIASSVMSKKIAAGADAIVLDVKVGLGAFMKSLEEAEALARSMVEIGRLAGDRMAALLSDMNQPLGHAVGNALEVREAIDTLAGGGPDDFRSHCVTVGGCMLYLAGAASSEEEGAKKIGAAFDDGRALEKFKALVQAQGGDVRYIDDPSLFPQAEIREPLAAPESGYIGRIHAREVGLTAMMLGAGRERKGEAVDHAVGLVLHHKVADRVEEGEPLATIHARSKDALQAAKERLLGAYAFSSDPVQPLPLFYKTIS